MSPKTILYVEDNELNRKIVRGLLKATTYTLIEANDGESGVAKALAERESRRRSHGVRACLLLFIRMSMRCGSGGSQTRPALSPTDLKQSQ